MNLDAIFKFTGQLWRFNGDKLINKKIANWQFHKERWDWDDTNGWLMSKKKYYQLTRPSQSATYEGARISLTNWQQSWEPWRKSRSITLEADPNVWFTLYNVRSKRYLTADSAGSTKIRGQLSI